MMIILNALKKNYILFSKQNLQLYFYISFLKHTLIFTRAIVQVKYFQQCKIFNLIILDINSKSYSSLHIYIHKFITLFIQKLV